MAYEKLTSQMTKQLAVMKDTLTISTPACTNANLSFDGAERGNGLSTYATAPDAGIVTAGAVINTANGDISQGLEKTLTLAQNHIHLKVSAVNGQLDFKDDDETRGLRVQNLASSMHKLVVENIATKGASASVAAASYEMKALARGSGILQALRGAVNLKGLFNPLALADIMDDSFKKFLPSEQSRKLYAETSLGKYALTDYFQTPDLVPYTWTAGTWGTLTCDVTFTNGVASAITLKSSTTMSGTLQAGTPLKIGVNIVDPLGNDSGVAYVAYVASDVALSGASISVPLTTPMYNKGGFKNVNTSGNITGAIVTPLLTTAKKYARAIIYTQATNLFRQAELPTLFNMNVQTVGEGTDGIRMKMTTNSSFDNYTSMMRIDTLTAQELAYNQWAHTVFFDITGSY